MKKLFLMALAVCIVTACEKDIVLDDATSTVVVDDEGNAVPTKKFTFTLKGDFSEEWKSVTRGYLQADGKDMTDLWVLDYMGDVLVQQIHQSDNTAEDFGRPSMTLAYGSHHVYFVASRGVNPTLNTTNGTITWNTVRDTFWKDYAVEVVSTSNGNRAVTLDRIVTKLTLKFTDAVSANASTINFTPSSWYYTLNYKTGEPTTVTASQTILTSVPGSYIGNTDVSISYFSLSPSTDWTTDVNINSKDGDNNIIGQGNMSGVPLKRNRVTEYSGPLFSSGGTMTTSLNTDWITNYEGEW